jgi:hypothetical protein
MNFFEQAIATQGNDNVMKSKILMRHGEKITLTKTVFHRGQACGQVGQAVGSHFLRGESRSSWFKDEPEFVDIVFIESAGVLPSR